MKARLLRKILSDTTYNISNNNGYIAVGSPYCHDLIKVDKYTLKMTYALTFPKSSDDREYIKGRGNGTNELLFIWDKLAMLIKTEAIGDIINGQDEIENPLPVFTVEKGILVSSFTDFYGWPNFTIDGHVMYENTHFKTKEEALIYGIGESSAAIEAYRRHIKERKEEIEIREEKINKHEQFIKDLEAQTD